MGKKENTPSPKKKSSKKQTRKGLIPWIGLTLFVCAWMFVLGILVGREMVPVKFDIEKLQNDLAALKEAVIKKELDQYKIDSSTDDSKTKMGFYETLKKTGGEAGLKNDTIERQKKSEPKKTASSQKKKSEPKKTASSQKKKSEPKKTASLQKKKSEPKKTASLQKKKMPTQKTDPAPKVKTSDSKKASPNNNKFTIQVASLKDSGVADKLVSRLKKVGYPAYRSIGKIPGKGIWYRVRVGYFNSRSEAGSTFKRLKKEKIDAIIVQR